MDQLTAATLPMSILLLGSIEENPMGGMFGEGCGDRELADVEDSTDGEEARPELTLGVELCRIEFPLRLPQGAVPVDIPQLEF